jgi:hypothetical protein
MDKMTLLNIRQNIIGNPTRYLQGNISRIWHPVEFFVDDLGKTRGTAIERHPNPRSKISPIEAGFIRTGKNFRRVEDHSLVIREFTFNDP